jgi:hypothetical protein
MTLLPLVPLGVMVTAYGFCAAETEATPAVPELALSSGLPGMLLFAMIVP